MKEKLLNKRTFVILGIIGLFAVAVIINYNRTKSKTAEKDNTADTPVIANADYYTAFRETRSSTREREIEYLEAILSGENTDEETAKEANAQKMSIVECMEKEFAIESQIKAKGFSDAAVTFHKGSVNVIVDAEELSGEQTAQILDIVKRETSEPAENIRISVRR